MVSFEGIPCELHKYGIMTVKETSTGLGGFPPWVPRVLSSILRGSTSREVENSALQVSLSNFEPSEQANRAI